MNIGVPFVIGAALLLSACASAPGLPPSGASLAEIEARFGKPSYRFTLPDGGTLLEFDGTGAPQTYMVRMDPQGRMLGAEQVLTEARLRTIVDGMPRQQVLMTIGHPSEVAPGGRMAGEIWSYHYRNTQCQWFQVVMGDDDRTIGPGTFGMLPACLHQP